MADRSMVPLNYQLKGNYSLIPIARQSILRDMSSTNQIDILETSQSERYHRYGSLSRQMDPTRWFQL